MQISVCVCVCLCMCVSVHVCVCVYIPIYIHTHIYRVHLYLYIFNRKSYFRIYLDSYGIMMIYENASLGTKIFVWKEEKIFLYESKTSFPECTRSGWEIKAHSTSCNQPVKNERCSSTLVSRCEVLTFKKLKSCLRKGTTSFARSITKCAKVDDTYKDHQVHLLALYRTILKSHT